VLSIDALRGVVMVLMVLDHSRDFFFGTRIDPTDLAHSSPGLFFTRWITHLCAPGFVLLAGMAVFFAMDRARDDPGPARRFLLKRGLYLVVLEITVVRLGWIPDPTYRFTLIQVIWAIGWSMVLLSLVTRAGPTFVGVLGLAIIAGHNLLDAIRPEMFGSASWLWVLVHGRAKLEPLPGRIVYVSYAVLPWFGVMAAGYGFGAIFKRSERRQRDVLAASAAALLAFVLIRGLNGYGNAAPWSGQPSDLGTAMSFLNAEKYPPSLAFVSLTLAVLMLLLALLERLGERVDGPLVTIGRVPLFFYLAHLFLLRFTSLAAAYARWGLRAFELPPAGTAGSPEYDLWVIWLIWPATVLLLYPACRWFAVVKRRRDDWWLRYL
jgi:uncharacterized membrane protein